MNQLPDFWRTEIYHPLTVHLPLVALILSTFFIILSLFIKRSHWFKMGSLLLIIGTIGAWIAVYTGNMADSVVARDICDPTVLESHENTAYLVSWIFTAASVAVIINHYLKANKLIKLAKAFIVVLSIAGSAFLVYQGHLGSTLVYQQAAGVYVPSEDCDEFSD